LIPFWNNFSTAKSLDANTTANNYDNSSNPTMQAKIMLNGNDRFATRKGDYFSLVQPYQHHENTPDVNHNGINVYSFALKPEEHQPSGTLNMSRIDTAVLSLSSSVPVLSMYMLSTTTCSVSYLVWAVSLIPIKKTNYFYKYFILNHSSILSSYIFKSSSIKIMISNIFLESTYDNSCI